MILEKMTNYKIQITNTEGGFVALLAVLISGAVAVAIGVSLIMLGIGASRTSLAVEQSGQAKALANDCAEEALQKIRESTTFSGNGNLSIGGGTCTYAVTAGSGQTRLISATGTNGSIMRKVTISITQINPTITISSWQETP